MGWSPNLVPSGGTGFGTAVVWWHVVFAAAVYFYPAPALVNYHRPILSWCGVPGLAVYITYIGGVIILKGRCRIDPKLGKVQDVARFALTLLAAAIPSAGIGTLLCWETT